MYEKLLKIYLSSEINSVQCLTVFLPVKAQEGQRRPPRLPRCRAAESPEFSVISWRSPDLLKSISILLNFAHYLKKYELT